MAGIFRNERKAGYYDKKMIQAAGGDRGDWRRRELAATGCLGSY